MYICNYASEYYIKGHRHTSIGRSIDQRDFHAAGAAELYTLIVRLTDRSGWDAVEEEAYQELGRLCGGLEVSNYYDRDAPVDDFMAACKAVIEKEKANG